MTKRISALSLSLCLLGSFALMPMPQASARIEGVDAPDGTHLINLRVYSPTEIAAALAGLQEVDASFDHATQLAWTSGNYAYLPGNFNGITAVRTAEGFESAADANDLDSPSPVDYNDPELSRLATADAPYVLAALQQTGEHFNEVAELSGAIADRSGADIETNTTRLINNVRWRIWADPDFKHLERVDIGQAVKTLSPASMADLTRLGQNSKTVAGTLASVPLTTQIRNGILSINQGAVLNTLTPAKMISTDKADQKLSRRMDDVYLTHYNLTDGSRDVLISPSVDGKNRVGLNMLIREKGPGFERTAYRISAPLHTGLQKVTTYSLTHLANGNLLESAEERFVNPNGIGSGNGVFVIKQMDGKVVKTLTQVPMRTQINPDGSMATYLKMGPDQEVLFQQDSRGLAQISRTDKDQLMPWESVDTLSLRKTLNEIGK